MHGGLWWVSLRERDHLEEVDVDGRTTLKWMLKECGEGGVDCIDVTRIATGGGLFGTL